MRVLVTSQKDIASLTIRECLIEDYGFIETDRIFDETPIYQNDIGTQLVMSSRDLIYTDHLDEHFSAEVYIFCSRHRAESGKPALLCHSTGNLGSEALFGGSPSSLSISIASLVSVALKRLYHEREIRELSEFDVTMEATHHGPTSMNTPMLFIELGSDENYWQHKEGSRAVAAAAIECTQAELVDEAFIGFGGTHYVSKFNRLVLEKNVRIGHIAPKYALDTMNADILRLMIERSKEKVTQAIIDWKGTNSAQRGKLLPLLDSFGIELIRARNI
ncbi:MAG: D-aminoacyl-tRNA deacylase [Candidatus Thorarchaeota archaeon]